MHGSMEWREVDVTDGKGGRLIMGAEELMDVGFQVRPRRPRGYWLLRMKKSIVCAGKAAGGCGFGWGGVGGRGRG